MQDTLLERIPGLGKVLDWVLFIVSNPVYIIIFSIFFLLFLVCVLLAYTFIMRLQNNRRERYIAGLEKEWQPFVWGYLEGDLTVDIFKSTVEKRDYQVFLEFIERYLIDLRGTEYDRLIYLLQKMEFGKFEMQQLQTKSEWERAYAAHILGIINYKLSIPKLENLLYDPSQIVAFFAARSILHLGEYNRFSVIINVLSQRQDFSIDKTKELLLIYGEADPEGLIRLLQQSRLSPRIIIDIVSILTQLNVFDAGEPLLYLAEHTDDDEIKIACIKALGELSIIKATDFMIKNLRDDDWVIRSQAARNLGKIGDEKMIQPLSLSLKDDNYWVKYHSASAIVDLGQKGVNFLKEYHATSYDDKSKNIVEQVLIEMT